MANPMIVYHKLHEIEVCVPLWWSDHEIRFYANKASPVGSTEGWQIRDRDCASCHYNDHRHVRLWSQPVLMA